MPTIRRSSGPCGLLTRPCGSPGGAGSGSPKSGEPAVYVMQHEGATRIVHQPDGTIVCEPASPHGAPSSLTPRAAETREGDTSKHEHGLLHNLAGTAAGKAVDVATHAASALVMLGGSVGFLLAAAEVLCEGSTDSMQVVKRATRGAQAIVLSTLTGAVVAPISAALGLARLAVRPALFGLAVHSGACWLRRHHLGAAALLRKLQSGDLVKQLEALRRIVARLSASPAFASQFKRLAGVEVLLRMLEDLLTAADQDNQPVPGPTAPLCASALAVLAAQGDAADTLVELGGVPLLLRAASCGLAGTARLSSPRSVRGAQPPGSAALLVNSMAALARATSKHAVAQQVLASEPGAAPLVVAVLEAATARTVRGATPDACDELRGYSVELAQALALEPSAKAELGAAGGVEALSAALVVSEPWSMGQAAAASALHSLVRGDPSNQRRLAAVAPAGLSAAIHRALVTGSSAGNSGNVMGSAAGGSSSPKCGSGKAAAGASPSKASLAGWGALHRPLAPEECHAHRADLLALSNVIARYTVLPPAPTPSPVPEAANSPRKAIMAPVAPPPVKTAFLQRLRLRSARPAPPPPAPAPPVAPAAVEPVTSMPGSPSAHAAALGAGSALDAPGAVPLPEGADMDADTVDLSYLDWEHDLGSPDKADKPEPASVKGQQAAPAPGSAVVA